MESWYLPITLLPSIGFFIMATTNVSNALSAEISRLIELDQSRDHNILQRKIDQLQRLSWALVLFYISAIFMALAGFIAGLGNNFMVRTDSWVGFLICVGILGTIIALGLLSFYAVQAVRIKRDQFKEM